MKLENLKEVRYDSPKNLKNLLQFFEEEEGLDDDYKVFNINQQFLARRRGAEVIRLEFRDEAPNDVIILFPDGETDSMPIQTAINELKIYRIERVY